MFYSAFAVSNDQFIRIYKNFIRILKLLFLMIIFFFSHIYISYLYLSYIVQIFVVFLKTYPSVYTSTYYIVFKLFKILFQPWFLYFPILYPFLHFFPKLEIFFLFIKHLLHFLSPPFPFLYKYETFYQISYPLRDCSTVKNTHYIHSAYSNWRVVVVMVSHLVLLAYL